MVNSIVSNTSQLWPSWVEHPVYITCVNPMRCFLSLFDLLLCSVIFVHIMVDIHLIDNIVYLRSTLAQKCFFVFIFITLQDFTRYLKVWNNSIEKDTFIQVYWLFICYSVNIAGCKDKLSCVSRPSEVGSVFLQQTHKHI